MNISHVGWGAAGGFLIALVLVFVVGDYTRTSNANRATETAVRTATAETVTAERAAGCIFRGRAVLGDDAVAEAALAGISPDYKRRDYVKDQSWANHPWLDGKLDSKAATACAAGLK